MADFEIKYRIYDSPGLWLHASPSDYGPSGRWDTYTAKSVDSVKQAIDSFFEWYWEFGRRPSGVLEVSDIEQLT